MRRSGRTTRIVDALVQEFFNNGGRAVVIDHNVGVLRPSEQRNRRVANTVMKRLSSEHNIITDLKVNENSVTITKINSATITKINDED